MSLHIDYQDGTVLVEGATEQMLPTGFKWDRRVAAYRAPANRYPELIYTLRSQGIPYDDRARNWEAMPHLKLRANRKPRDYQSEAVASWMNSRRGIVVLPTGSGKTFVAELVIAAIQRPTLIIAPTLDLVSQWRDRLQLSFGVDVGALGGGEHTVLPITVSTYDSAQIHMSRYGNRFALLVYDEVHHLPAEQNLLAAVSSMAPFRLGLTATLERQDGREELLDAVIGSEVYRKEISDLSGDWLSDYDVIRLFVDLQEQEAIAYRQARETYLQFLRQKRISVGGPNGWRRFIRAASRSKLGRAAMSAHAKSKRIIQSSESKIDALAEILAVEAGRRSIVFTSDNFTAYRISSQFLAPCITHQTDLKERSQILKDFESGRLPLLITSRVLNEGVDLPTAEVAIVLSGSGTVREHVQRLGRILRPMAGKKALMYEVVASDTAEESTSARRRKHDAYQ